MSPEVQWPSLDNTEIGYLIDVDGDTLTIERGQEGTTPMQVRAGWKVIASITSKTIEDLEEAISGVAGNISGKVDKEDGKGLSANDFTTYEKTKLAEIAPEATQNAPDAELRDRATHTGSQAIATVIGLQAALDSKASTIHTHVIADTSDLQTALDGKANTSHPHTIAQISSLQAALDGKVNTSALGQADGVATLDSAGKVPFSQLPSSIMEYKGVWDSSTNTPTLADGTGDIGDVYKVTGNGTVDLGSGAISFNASDYIIYNGSTWEKSDTTDSVTSVAGKTGAVTLTRADVGLASVNNTADANKPVSTAQQAALNLKLDIRTGNFIVYTNGADGLPSAQSYTSAATANTIPFRNGSGQFNAGTPTVAGNVATKGYVDSTTPTIVRHGSVAGTARPSDASTVMWIGSVQPTNMTTADLWVEG
ncbi:hypothetical protein RCF27_09375 [Rhodococcus pyridinivorans]|uniref:hypothetical protein n=1 Tax=Rhodococcus pyridinivorans TaxID=103816 RepID=UPI00280AC61C|nr:hypothetical protein [Rhodococcus pyridinivorans]WMM74468.1 hypothetical protein RCF27_09375 [Rhodococcus pyridinivorans]